MNRIKDDRQPYHYLCCFLFVNDDLTHFGNNFDIKTMMTITVEFLFLISAVLPEVEKS